MLAMQEYQTFHTRLVTRVRPLITETVRARHSDITGTIAQWTQRPPGGRAYTRVFLFSDMLENSQALPWRSFRDMRPEQAMSVVRQYETTPSVANADVRIVGFGRLHEPGRPPLPADVDHRLRQFWISYFRAGDARNVSFESAISN